jgi:hypothetical protein
MGNQIIQYDKYHPKYAINQTEQLHQIYIDTQQGRISTCFMGNQIIQYVKYHPKYAINQTEQLHQIYIDTQQGQISTCLWAIK